MYVCTRGQGFFFLGLVIDVPNDVDPSHSTSESSPVSVLRFWISSFEFAFPAVRPALGATLLALPIEICKSILFMFQFVSKPSQNFPAIAQNIVPKT